jgi:hypothetical protein
MYHASENHYIMLVIGRSICGEKEKRGRIYDCNQDTLELLSVDLAKVFHRTNENRLEMICMEEESGSSKTNTIG